MQNMMAPRVRRRRIEALLECARRDLSRAGLEELTGIERGLGKVPKRRTMAALSGHLARFRGAQ